MKRVLQIWVFLVCAVTMAVAQTDSCVIADVPVTWDFETGNTAGTASRPLPACWNRITGSLVSPYVTSAAIAHSGSYSLMFSNYVSSTVVLPTIDTAVLSVSALNVSFFVKTSQVQSGLVLEVGVMTDPTDIATFVAIDTLTDFTTSFQQVDIPLDSYTGNGLHIAVRNPGGGTGSLYIDDLSLSYIPGCLPPDSLSASVTVSTSMLLSWVHGGMSATSVYLVHYKKASSTVWTIDTVVGALTHLLPNLDPLTNYQAFVVAECNPLNPTGTISFTTPCITYTDVPINIDFEGVSTLGYSSVPECWHRIPASSFGGGVVSDAGNAYSGSNVLRISHANTSLTVLPEIDTDYVNVSDLYISFQAKITGNANKNTLELGLMTDPTVASTFTPVQTFRTLTSDYQLYTAYLSAYAGSGTYLAIRNTSTYENSTNTFIDDVVIDTIPECPYPANLTCQHTTATSVELQWTGFSNGSGQYLVHYKPQNAQYWNVVTATVSEPRYVLNGLTPNTDYLVYLVSDCGDNIPSNTVNFSTICAGFTTVPQFCDFEGPTIPSPSTLYDLPECWFAFNGALFSPDVFSFADQAYSGSHYLHFQNSTTSIAVMPPVDTTVLNIQDLQVSFYAMSYEANEFEVLLDVGIVEDHEDATSFTVVRTITELTTAYQLFEVPLNEYAGTGAHIAFRNRGYYYPSISIDDITIDTIAGCPYPLQLSAAAPTSSSVTFSWMGFNVQQPYYTVYYRPVGDSVWSSFADSVSFAQIILSGLQQETQYEAYVVSACHPTSPSNTVVFETGCDGLAALPRTWDFESSNWSGTAEQPLPACWSRPSGITNPYVADGNAFSGSKSLYFNNYYNQDETVVLPAIDTTVTPLHDLMVSLFAKGDNPNIVLQVGVMTDPDDVTTFAVVQDLGAPSGNYTAYDIPLSGYQGVGQYIAIRLHDPGNYGGHIYVDDVTVGLEPACARPSTPVVTNITATTALVHWTHDADSTRYFVFYQPSGASDWLCDTVLSTMSPYSHTLTALSSSTQYQVYVVAECNPEMQTGFVGFQTDCALISIVPQFWDFEQNNIGGTTSYPLSACWNRTHPDYPYVHYFPSDAHSGVYKLRYPTAHVTYTILPQIDTNYLHVNELQVSLYARAFSGNHSNMFITMGVMTDPADISTFVPVKTIYGITETYTLLDFPLGNYTGQGTYIAYLNSHTGSGWSELFVDDVTLYALPDCQRPTDLTIVNLTSTTAELMWHHDADSATYHIFYKEQTDSVWSETIVFADTTVVLIGLNPITYYDAYVVADCNPDNPSPTLTFYTHCVEIAAVPQFWDFEDYQSVYNNFPVCWDKVNHNNLFPYLYTEAGAGYGGSDHFLYYRNAYPDIITLPAINTGVLNVNELNLSFYAKADINAPNSVLEIGVSNHYRDTTGMVVVQNITGLTTEYQLFEISLAGYTGDGAFITIGNRGNDNARIYVDNVTLYDTLSQPDNPDEPDDSTAICQYDLSHLVRLYPNPARDYVDVRVTDENVRISGIEVYDIYGKVVRTVVGANNDSPTYRINLSGLASGIYIAHVRTKTGIIDLKFVKNDNPCFNNQ